MLNGDVEHGLDQMKANIPSDDTCYDSDPGGIEQALARREHFQDSSEQRGDCDGHGTRRRRRKLTTSIAMVQVRFVWCFSCFALMFFIIISFSHVFSHTQMHPNNLIPFRAFTSPAENNERNNIPHVAPRGKSQ